jgi:hypothetical protein
MDIGAGVPQKRSVDGSIISAEQIMRIVGNSIERLSGGRKDSQRGLEDFLQLH